MLELVDTHCHLDFELFKSDLPRVVDAARRAGICAIINPAINLESSRQIVALAEKLDFVFAAVGVHPNDALEWNQDTRQQLAELARHPKVVAVGEIGLDYYRDYAPRDMQRRIFEEQLSLAAENDLPVIIHNREATDDVLDILAGYQATLKESTPALAEKPGVMHSFSADTAAAQRAIDIQFRIGITGPVTFKNAHSLRQVVREVPMQNLLIETDAPFLTPHPHRGERNEPAYVAFVAEKIAELKALTMTEIAKTTTQNADRLFGWRAAG
ncbi:MAG: TatD family hydrolase [Anaerolineales bacterium]